MADNTNAKPVPHKWESSAPAVPTREPPAAPQTPAPASNTALIALNAFGALLFVGGLIAMIVGMNRTAPRGNPYSDTPATTINAALQFASTNTLIVLIGGIALLLGGMCLVGSLVVAAIKSQS